MQVTTLKHNHYKVKNGVLVPRAQATERTPNYRFVPYTPLNKPTDQDYFRATIDELLKQNSELRSLLDDKDKEIEKLQALAVKNVTNKEIQRLQEQLFTLKSKYAATESQLQKQKGIIVTKDKKMQQVRSQNYQLARNIDNISKQLQGLKNKLKISELEAKKINNVLESFSSTIEKIMELEKYLEENPQIPVNFNNEDQRYSDENVHLNTNDFDEDEDIDDRFMTPRQKIHELRPSNSYKNRSAEQHNVVHYIGNPQIKMKGSMHSTQDQSKLGSEVSKEDGRNKYRVESNWVNKDKFPKKGDEPALVNRSSIFYASRK